MPHLTSSTLVRAVLCALAITPGASLAQETTPAPRQAAPLVIRHDRTRPLESWRPAITSYSKKHYGEATSVLHPTCIVLHFTAGTTFPWNLVKSGDFAGEKPGLASHYVIDGAQIWQLLPTDVRSRGAYGINHRAINIEMVAANAADLARRPRTLESCARLVRDLQQQYAIPSTRIYSHAEVSRMDRRRVPEVLDRVHPEPYGKPDPGEQNMKKIHKLLENLEETSSTP